MDPPLELLGSRNPIYSGAILDFLVRETELRRSHKQNRNLPLLCLKWALPLVAGVGHREALNIGINRHWTSVIMHSWLPSICYLIFFSFFLLVFAKA